MKKKCPVFASSCMWYLYQTKMIFKESWPKKNQCMLYGRSVYVTDSYKLYHNTFLMVFLYEGVGKIEDVDFSVECWIKDAGLIEVCSL